MRTYNNRRFGENDMRRVLVLVREDLIRKSILSPAGDLCCENFEATVRDIIPNFELVVFHCSLTDEYIVLKDRYNSPSGEVLCGVDDRSRILNILMGTI